MDLGLAVGEAATWRWNSEFCLYWFPRRWRQQRPAVEPGPSVCEHEFPVGQGAHTWDSGKKNRRTARIQRSIENHQCPLKPAGYGPKRDQRTIPPLGGSVVQSAP